jgi:hypothetical protein
MYHVHTLISTSIFYYLRRLKRIVEAWNRKESFKAARSGTSTHLPRQRSLAIPLWGPLQNPPAIHRKSIWESISALGLLLMSREGPFLLDIAMTLSWTRPYPDPTRCRVGSDPSRVPVRLSWAGLINTFVRSGYPAKSGK